MLLSTVKAAMPRTALILYAIFLLLALGGRAAVHRWHTGSFGLRVPAPGKAPLEAVIGAGIVLASVLLGVVSPLLQLGTVVAAREEWLGAGVRAFGVACFGAGLIGVLVSQFWMGASWRVGVDRSERTRLITTGPFAYMRNPIFSFMLVAILGVSVLVPNRVTLAGYVLLLVAIEAQVRLVEEPHLRCLHGERYTEWAARVGRFVPGVGRLR